MHGTDITCANTAAMLLQVVLLDVMEETGQEMCTELRKKYGDDKVVFYRCDVASEEDLVSIFPQYGIQQNYVLYGLLCRGLPL